MCVRECVRACVCVRVRAYVCACVCALSSLCLSPSPDVRGQEGCRWSSFPSDSDRKREIASEAVKTREKEKINEACEEQKDREGDKRQ